VPGGHEGPSGVIVCCENCLVYKNLGDQPDIKVPIPRRRVSVRFVFCFYAFLILYLKNELDEGDDRPMMIICSAAHKTKSMYFFLVQSEQGDVFKVTLETDADIVTEMRIKVCILLLYRVIILHLILSWFSTSTRFPQQIRCAF